MSTKQAPKSCSCDQCKRGKHSAGGHYMMKADEHGFRHQQKVILDEAVKHCNTFHELMEVDVGVVPIGNYYD